jgi:hypothetical protein
MKTRILMIFSIGMIGFVGFSFADESIDSTVYELEYTGSYELEEALCIGGRGMVKNEKCEIIGKYDIQTGIPIVENKSQCDLLDGTWYNDKKLCDSKYAPVEYRFQFGPAHNVYDDSEEMKMASEKVFFSEESMGFGGGTSMLNGSDFQLSTVIIAIVIGTGSFFGLMVFWRKRK